MNELEELREMAYENSRIYKERIKKWHDAKVKIKSFQERDQVLLFNARLRLFPGKLKRRWLGPFVVSLSTLIELWKFTTLKEKSSKLTGKD